MFYIITPRSYISAECIPPLRYFFVEEENDDNIGDDIGDDLSANDVDDVSDENDNSFEETYMEDKDEMSKYKLELIEGDKDGSKWLVVEDIFILHKYRSTGNETFWECSGRRKFNCPFRAATIPSEKDDDDHELVFMYKLDRHDCGQTKLGPIIQKFRNGLKSRILAK